ncbi:MAG: hypothetical protein Q7T11_05345 [Deltaproteobacteria bacterium]|nr:hypothetical protein [Deltaproteobacteria bacterium]
MTDILDIEGIIRPFWERHLEAILLSIAALGLLLLFFFLFKSWRRRKPVKTLPPDKEALRDLAELDGKKWIEAGEFRKYYFALSAILKRYLEGRFGFPATDMTTEELRDTLGVGAIHELPLHRKMLPFFERADLVKFADLIPTKEGALQDRQAVTIFIQ